MPDAFPTHRLSVPELDELSDFLRDGRQHVHDGVVSIGPDSGTYFEWHARTDRDACAVLPVLPRDSQLSLPRKLSLTGPNAFRVISY